MVLVLDEVVIVPSVKLAVAAGKDVTTADDVANEDELAVVEDVLLPVVANGEDEAGDDVVVVVLQGHCKVGRFEHRSVAVLLVLLFVLVFVVVFNDE